MYRYTVGKTLSMLKDARVLLGLLATCKLDISGEMSRTHSERRKLQYINKQIITRGLLQYTLDWFCLHIF